MGPLAWSSLQSWGAGCSVSRTQENMSGSLGSWLSLWGFSLLGAAPADGPPSVWLAGSHGLVHAALDRAGSWEAWGSVSQTGLFPWIVVLYLFPLIYFSCLFIH